MGYRPNPVGRALRQARVGSVGLYLPSTAVHYGYYSEVTTGVAEELHLAGSSLTVLPNVAHGRRIDAFTRVDAFILIEPHSDDPGVAEILAQELPVVSGDRPPPDTGVPWGLVESPNAEIVRNVFDRFMDNGAQRPGLLQIERVSEWSVELERQYLRWSRERGLEPRIADASIHATNEELARELSGFFALESGCDAIFTAGDGIAIRLAGILRSLGITIGKDVAVISGVDSALMQFHTPAITAVDLQPRLFGRRCAELVLALLNEERPRSPVRTIVPAPIVERASG